MSSFYPSREDREDLWDDLVTGVWHRPVPDTRPDYQLILTAPVTALDPVLPDVRRVPRTLVLALLASILLGALMASGGYAYLDQLRLPAMALYESTSEGWIVREIRSHVVLSAPEDSRARHRRSAAYRDLWQASTWYHPLADEILLPGHLTRKFGAKRQGPRPAECLRGHCGVDIGQFGLTVRAAQDGLVDRVQRQGTRKEGRYVRIVHDNGLVSYYMHLHRIRNDLRAGMRVSGGEPIGVVGRTGIKRSKAHLHFAVAVVEGKKKVFLDPEPLLRRSVIIEDDLASHADAPDPMF